MDPTYLDFLRAFDPHVPQKDERPWLWPILIDGIMYAIPCTTSDSGFGFAGMLRCGALPDRGLNLRYMVPMPQKALLWSKPLPPELQAELGYYEMNRKYIEEEARLIHRLCKDNQMERSFSAHSCDFTKLEDVYTNWRPGLYAGHFLCPEKEGPPMPVSRNGYLRYTKEQYQEARTKSAIEYALAHGYGPELKQEHGWYKMKAHDSMIFAPDGRWFWNSRNVSGRALDFMIHYEGKSIPEAVIELVGDQAYTRGTVQRSTAQPASAPAPAPQIPKTAFIAPAKAENFRYLFQYLCDRRGVEKSVVQEMIRQGRCYQSCHVLPNGRKIYNAAFVYRDPDYKIIGVYERGMMDRAGQPPYKKEIPGSDKQHGWLIKATVNRATELRVFEAAIDAASDASLVAMADDNWNKQPVDRLSCEGVSYLPIHNYLRRNPQIGKITLMLDADQAGRTAAERFAALLQQDGFTGMVEIKEPPFGKDWNNVLTETRAMAREASWQQEQLPEPEYELEM